MDNRVNLQPHFLPVGVKTVACAADVKLAQHNIQVVFCKFDPRSVLWKPYAMSRSDDPTRGDKSAPTTYCFLLSQ